MALWYNSTLNAVKGLKMALVMSGKVSRCRLWSVWWCLCLWCGAVAVSVALLVVFWSLVLSGVGVVSSVALWVFWCAVVVSCCLWSGVGSSLVVCGSVCLCGGLVFSVGVFSGLVVWCLWWSSLLVSGLLVVLGLV